jgi:hypothetical protein
MRRHTGFSNGLRGDGEKRNAAIENKEPCRRVLIFLGGLLPVGKDFSADESGRDALDYTINDGLDRVGVPGRNHRRDANIDLVRIW